MRHWLAGWQRLGNRPYFVISLKFCINPEWCPVGEAPLMSRRNKDYADTLAGPGQLPTIIK